jgi:hypothetical protein
MRSKVIRARERLRVKSERERERADMKAEKAKEARAKARGKTVNHIFWLETSPKALRDWLTIFSHRPIKLDHGS